MRGQYGVPKQRLLVGADEEAAPATTDNAKSQAWTYGVGIFIGFMIRHFMPDTSKRKKSR